MNSEINNLTYIVKDIIKHPEDDLDYIKSITDKGDFKEADVANIRNALSVILHNEKLSVDEKNDLLLNSWKINFKARPPSMKDFISEKYLGSIHDSVRSYVREWLVDFYNERNYTFVLVLYTAIRLGKSFAVVIATLYTLYVTNLMRDPKKYFGLNKSSSPSICFASFSIEKTEQILGDKLFNFLIANSDLYLQAKRIDQMNKFVKESNPEQMVWTKAKPFSFLTTESVQVIITSSPTKLLGLDFIFGVISEINFFGEGGKSPEEGMKLITELTGRIKGTLPQYKNMYYPRIFIDSSPYDMELNPVDKYLVEVAPTLEEWKVIRGARWDFQPEVFIEYKRTGKTFPVFKGSGSHSPKILEEHEVINYEEEDIINVPIDLQNHFQSNLLSKSLQDWAGEPTGGVENIVQDKQSIEDMFIDYLPNVYSYIIAPASLPPEGLIWNKIRDQFFFKVHEGEYQFHRNPHAVRYLSVDQSEKTDWTGISCCHLERDVNGKLIYVVDFTICIVPTKEKINLEAIKFFIHDLKKYGKLNFRIIGFDQFQSSATIQYLERYSFEVKRQSVDISTEPYLNMISSMQRRIIKVGRNIVLKNNLKSLILAETKGKTKKKKVDHTIGKLYTEVTDNWDTCMVGKHMKDLSDSLASCLYLCETYGNRNPIYIWKDLDKNVSDDIQLKNNFMEGIAKKFKLGVV